MQDLDYELCGKLRRVESEEKGVIFRCSTILHTAMAMLSLQKAQYGGCNRVASSGVKAVRCIAPFRWCKMQNIFSVLCSGSRCKHRRRPTSQIRFHVENGDRTQDVTLWDGVRGSAKRHWLARKRRCLWATQRSQAEVLLLCLGFEQSTRKRHNTCKRNSSSSM